MTKITPYDPHELGADFAYTVSDEDNGKRLDAVLAGQLDTMSRNRVQTLIKAGEVTVGSRKIIEPKHRVNEGDCIELQLPEAEDPEPQGENIPLAVVFEDDELIVIDKPAGLVVHPGAGNWTGTLVNALIHHCGSSLSGIGGVKRPGIVHRIDKDTSGLLVVAKTDRAHQGLSAQFADHGRSGPLERAYSALVWGAPSSLKGTIDANLARSHANRQKITVVKAAGRHAVTHWKIKDRFGNPEDEPLASLIECRLETGRTHQIRVHMAYAGYPLIGDKDYGSGFKTKINRLEQPLKSIVSRFNRQALHAGLLAFEHPLSGETMRFTSPYPADFSELLHALQKF
ncbi:ribosomal large subunit pseudouridine synthase D [Roseibium hamelinense]|uniref:Pseudouridine synthase n=1 Tax=Roseibium hamelinense TaxID=150831 RepID=A0A562SNG1_9HYPH|nr:RluA family pseudouridine synthase [Roseibium hamelinense]MTI44945.1 RluA family pseudouridine synthase [Roseibium hamelinense]TWI82206.1 ribosomal large subunit pseudouridine synthase D [Roseibium hamelinense]